MWLRGELDPWAIISLLFTSQASSAISWERKPQSSERPVEATPVMRIVGAQENTSGMNTARQTGGLNPCGSAGKLWCQYILWEATGLVQPTEKASTPGLLNYNDGTFSDQNGI